MDIILTINGKEYQIFYDYEKDGFKLSVTESGKWYSFHLEKDVFLKMADYANSHFIDFNYSKELVRDSGVIKNVLKPPAKAIRNHLVKICEGLDFIEEKINE